MKDLRLPEELWCQIFKFDCTYVQIYSGVFATHEFVDKLWNFWMKRVMKSVVEFSCHEPEFYQRLSCAFDYVRTIEMKRKNGNKNNNNQVNLSYPTNISFRNLENNIVYKNGQYSQFWTVHDDTAAQLMLHEDDDIFFNNDDNDNDNNEILLLMEEELGGGGEGGGGFGMVDHDNNMFQGMGLVPSPIEISLEFENGKRYSNYRLYVLDHIQYSNNEYPNESMIVVPLPEPHAYDDFQIQSSSTQYIGKYYIIEEAVDILLRDDMSLI